MTLSPQSRRKIIVMVLILVTIPVLRMGLQMLGFLPEAPSPQAPAPVAAPTPTAAPVPQEARPAPPLVTATQPIIKPAPVHKKIVPPKKVPVKKMPVPVQAPTVPATPVSIPFVPSVPPPPPPQEWQGNDTSVTHAGQVVIHNDHQWVHFWSEHHPHEAAPDVDFTNNMVIGVFAGPRPADPFSIRIVRVQTLGNTLSVDYRERLPPPGTFAVNVTVYPYDLKVIPASSLPVKFNVLEPENVSR